jgi:hypothetical protein
LVALAQLLSKLGAIICLWLEDLATGWKRPRCGGPGQGTNPGPRTVDAQLAG